MIKYTKDGASYLDSRGKAVWILSYEMKHPMITVNGDFAAIETVREIPFISVIKMEFRVRRQLLCRF